MDKEEMVPDAFKRAGKPLRPGDVAKMTGLDSKEVSKIHLKNVKIVAINNFFASLCAGFHSVAVGGNHSLSFDQILQFHVDKNLHQLEMSQNQLYHFLIAN